MTRRLDAMGIPDTGVDWYHADLGEVADNGRQKLFNSDSVGSAGKYCSMMTALSGLPLLNLKPRVLAQRLRFVIGFIGFKIRV